MDELVSLCKRRGFIFQSGEIYGGLQGIYDYGPMGVELKKNIKDSWWSSMVYKRDDIEGLDASILTNPKVLKYSGHEDTFSDPLVDCKDCNGRFRADHLNDSKCPLCGSTNLTDPRPFNLMFKTTVGPVDDDKNFAYLRPETAQQIFTNEITPRNFIFRVREFEQMELEFFVKNGDDDKWHEYWLEERLSWWEDQGVPRSSLEILDVPAGELSHYSKKTYDLMYKFPHGVEELEGIANRTDFDLGSHSKNQNEFEITAKVTNNKESNSKLAVHNLDEKKWEIPYVIEPSAGVDRAFLAILNEAYTEEELPDGKTRTVLKLSKHLAPISAAVIPLKKNDDKLVKLAKDIKGQLQQVSNRRIILENTGNIGKSYRKHDEIGTPNCITVDYDSLEKKTVTLRDRDTMDQKTIIIDDISKHLLL